jgi:hypothetical protein
LITQKVNSFNDYKDATEETKIDNNNNAATNEMKLINNNNDNNAIEVKQNNIDNNNNNSNNNIEGCNYKNNNEHDKEKLLLMQMKNKVNDIIELLKISVDCERISSKKTKDYAAKLKAVLDFSEYGKYYRNLAICLDIKISERLIADGVNLSLIKNREKFIDEFIIEYIKKFNVE